MMRGAAVAVILMLAFSSAGWAEWYKGNTHTHTNISDGDSSPDVAVKWYKDHGYRFVVMTDHNKTGDGGMQVVYGEPGKFLVITGNEISCSSEKKPVHLTAIAPSDSLNPVNDSTRVITLQKNVNAIRKAGAVPVINHPNFVWAFGAGEMGQVTGWSLLEIENSHPMVHNRGGIGKPSTEEMWDALLTKGMKIYGVASDDTHGYKDFTPFRANPGRGWVCVRSDDLTPGAICAALDKGDFYSSTGVELEDVTFDAASVSVKIKPAGVTAYVVEFIGKGGKVFAAMPGPEASYRITGKEGYVRARISDSNGFHAWTQPVFVGGK